MLNALSHRDYQSNAAVYVKQYPDRIVIENPGGFLDGITEDNIITHPSIPRNKLIAETLQNLKYVQRTGQGVDIIFKDMVSMGKPYPRYRSFNDAVSLTIFSAIDNTEFVKFITEVQDKNSKIMPLAEMMILRDLLDNRKEQLSELARKVQKSLDETKKSCNELVSSGLIEIVGKQYMLTAKVYEVLKSDVEYTRDKTVQYIRAKNMILEYLQTNDQITSAKDCNTNAIRDITELSTGEKNVIAFLYFLEKLHEVKETVVNKPRIIVFDDPMNSNDDGMQYLIIEELQILMKKLLETDHFILLTHNKHFYINVRYNHKYSKDKFIRFQSNGTKTQIISLVKEDDDFKTSYESLWLELKLLYEYDITSADMLLNPIRRIIETFTKFNALNKTDFCNEVAGAKKLFDVNSHSIDDIEAELNGKNKQEVIQMLYDCFSKNDYGNHFLKYWKNASVDETGKLVSRN